MSHIIEKIKNDLKNKVLSNKEKGNRIIFESERKIKLNSKKYL